MIPKYAHSLGGKKTALLLRNKAVTEYNNNPILCKNCNNIIKVLDTQKVSQVKQKKFCNRSCSASFNNKSKKKKIKPKKEKIAKFTWISTKTKKEVFETHSNWQSARTSIRRHAKFIFDKEVNHKSCKNCGYDKHIEICHIKSVSSFSDESLISEINNKNNLIGLCPNCHWEFDNNILKNAE